MSQPIDSWIHIGICPVCESGMCRVRRCTGDGTTHFFALCDECDAIWTEPSTESEERIYADSDSPTCPICKADLYGDQCDWATLDEITDDAWRSNLILTSKHVR